MSRRPPADLSNSGSSQAPFNNNGGLSREQLAAMLENALRDAEERARLRQEEDRRRAAEIQREVAANAERELDSSGEEEGENMVVPSMQEGNEERKISEDELDSLVPQTSPTHPSLKRGNNNDGPTPKRR